MLSLGDNNYSLIYLYDANLTFKVFHGELNENYKNKLIKTLTEILIKLHKSNSDFKDKFKENLLNYFSKRGLTNINENSNILSIVIIGESKIYTPEELAINTLLNRLKVQSDIMYSTSQKTFKEIFIKAFTKIYFNFINEHIYSPYPTEFISSELITILNSDKITQKDYNNIERIIENRVFYNNLLNKDLKQLKKASLDERAANALNQSKIKRNEHDYSYGNYDYLKKFINHMNSIKKNENNLNVLELQRIEEVVLQKVSDSTINYITITFNGVEKYDRALEKHRNYRIEYIKKNSATNINTFKIYYEIAEAPEFIQEYRNNFIASIEDAKFLKTFLDKTRYIPFLNNDYLFYLAFNKGLNSNETINLIRKIIKIIDANENNIIKMLFNCEDFSNLMKNYEDSMPLEWVLELSSSGGVNSKSTSNYSFSLISDEVNIDSLKKIVANNLQYSKKEK